MKIRFTKQALLALASTVALGGALSVVLAGEHCKYDSQNAKADAHESCPFEKDVTKAAKMTDTGAVVTLTGKNEAAIKVIKSHLDAHMNGEPCPDCPLSMKGVTVAVAMLDNGGTLTITGDSPETIKSVQKWANGSASSCCMKGKPAEKA